MGAYCGPEVQGRCTNMSFAGSALQQAKAAAEAIEQELAGEEHHSSVGLRERMHQKTNPIYKDKSLADVRKEAFNEKVKGQITNKREEVISALEVTTGQSPVSKTRSGSVRRGSVGAGVVLQVEVDRLGHRAHVVVTGKLAEVPERPFETKIMAMRGLATIEELAEDYNVGVRCVNGSTPAFVRPNQDDFFFAITSDLYRMGAVVDGHGSHGHMGSAIVRDALLRTLLGHLPWSNDTKEGVSEAVKQQMHVAAMRDAIVLAFEKASTVLHEHEDFDARLSGVSACLAIHDVKHSWMHVAWIGNCRCIIADLQEEEYTEVSKDGKVKPKQIRKNLVAVPLSIDHTTKNPEERTRVEHAGAELRRVKGDNDEICAPGEQLPGIPLTRCLGNLVGQQLGVKEEVQTFNRAVTPLGKDARFMVLGTDGIFDVMRNSEVIGIMNEAKKDNMEFALNHVVSKAHNAWVKKAHKVGNVIDDLTCLCIWLKGITAKAPADMNQQGAR